MTDRKRLPTRRVGKRFTLGSGVDKFHISTGEYPDGRLGEVFIDCSKEGTFTRDVLKAFAMCLSVGLQHGVPLEAYMHSFRDFSMQPDFIRSLFLEVGTYYAGKGQTDVTSPR